MNKSGDNRASPTTPDGRHIERVITFYCQTKRGGVECLHL